MKRIILASASPRRKELLKELGIPFEIVESEFDETPREDLAPENLALFYAHEKAEDVAKKIGNGVVIGVDTIVVFDGKPIGKPSSKTDAKTILKKLSGNMHTVITAYSIIDTQSKMCISNVVKTKVWFRRLSNNKIDEYGATGEPMDKAGAYGIQGKGGEFVEKIEGDFNNVVGLPITALVHDLKKFGFVGV